MFSQKILFLVFLLAFFNCRLFSPYWPLKFIISIFKFDFFFLLLFFVLSLALALSLLRLGFVVVVFLFLKVRVAKMTITSAFIIMLNTGCSLDTGKRIISHWLPCDADGRKGVRSRDNQNFSHAWITKFSYPWCSTGELRYTSFNYHPDFLEVKDK